MGIVKYVYKGIRYLESMDYMVFNIHIISNDAICIIKIPHIPTLKYLVITR